ncbi:lytic transglycosylase domain-containing protein [Streptomyces abyssomicinicus]|uniref:lytic transglycosylase domain-containing protein n=1 Tax=Streptomyces abyssomicinicus TaxID=574929 RepID=UPI001250C904|nr:lytic transglycosylase domain-containing protein [Streptomyces abyssomicinicus]
MAAHIGRHLRRGAATTAVAAIAVAALTASQAPGVAERPRSETGDSQPIPDLAESPGDDSYYTDLPPLNSPAGGSGSDGSGESGIPATVLDAYKKAEATLNQAKPGCNLPWQLLAAIGQVESGQARGGRVDASGNTTSPIVGPALNGEGFAHIRDTDNGAFDGDATYDRAVGPMQFIPSTWEWAGKDGNGDGARDPNNVYDAALAAGHYLCRYNWNLAESADLERAILSYNNSRDYLNTVLRWMETFRNGVQEIPDGTGTLPVHRNDGHLVTPTSPSAPPSTGPGAGSGNGSGSGGGGSDTPGGGGTTPPPATDPPAGQTPTDSVQSLERTAGGSLSATAGTSFAEEIAVRAETSGGAGVAKVRIRFTVVGGTGTAFEGGETVATVQTDGSGVATAPALVAGEKTGAFVVRATVVGRDVTAAEWDGVVTVRTADKLTLAEGEPLVCPVGGEFAGKITVEATRDGAPAAKVGATVTLIRSAEDTAQNDKGPYFEDPENPDGAPLRTIGLTADADGVLTLPTLFAGDTAGTYLLLVDTPGAGTLTVELTVEATGAGIIGEVVGAL